MIWAFTCGKTSRASSQKWLTCGKTVRASSKKLFTCAKRFVPARKSEKVVLAFTCCKTVCASSKNWFGPLHGTTVRASSKKWFGTLHVAKRFVPARTSCFGFYIWQNGSCQRQPSSKCGLVFTFGKTCRADFEKLFLFLHLATPVGRLQNMILAFKFWQKNIMRASKGLLDFPHLPIVLFFNIPGSLCNFLAFLEPCYFSPFVTACPCGTLSFCCAFVAFLFLVAPLWSH